MFGEDEWQCTCTAGFSESSSSFEAVKMCLSCLNPDWVKKSSTSVTDYRPVSTEWQIRNLATRKRKYSVPCSTGKFFSLVFKLSVGPQMSQLPVWGLNVGIVYTHAVISLLEKEMATHSSLLVWRIPRTEEPGGLQSMGSLRVGYDWATSLSLFTVMRWRRKWQPTPVFLPGESQGQRSLVGCRLWGRAESDATEAT